VGGRKKKLRGSGVRVRPKIAVEKACGGSDGEGPARLPRSGGIAFKKILGRGILVLEESQGEPAPEIMSSKKQLGVRISINNKEGKKERGIERKKRLLGRRRISAARERKLDQMQRTAAAET